MINTVIFDMDGTVLNTLEDLTAAVNYVLVKHGMPERSAEDYRQFFGNGIRWAIKCAAPKDTPEEMLDEMVRLFREYYDVHCLDRTQPYEGILEMMEELHRRGFNLAIVSNKIDSAVKELSARFFSRYVDVAIGEREGIRRKPAPDTVWKALEELGSTKEEAIYVGDSEVDLKTAENAGIPCICVLWGFRDRGTLLEKGASLFAEKPGDICAIL